MRNEHWTLLNCFDIAIFCVSYPALPSGFVEVVGNSLFPRWIVLDSEIGQGCTQDVFLSVVVISCLQDGLFLNGESNILPN